MKDGKILNKPSMIIHQYNIISLFLRWPRGLSSLETRQNNRRIYDNYVCRRVPGKQAVLVLPSDNAHMDETVMVHTVGLIMIFAHGVE